MATARDLSGNSVVGTITHVARESSVNIADGAPVVLTDASNANREVYQKGDNSGAAHVRLVSAVGAAFCATMTAPVDAPDTDTTEIWSSTGGAKLIEIYPLTAIDAGEAVIAGYSTISSDTDVEANLALAITAHATATGVLYPNQRVATTGVPLITIPWDGETTIKRFACISTDDKAIVYIAIITY